MPPQAEFIHPTKPGHTVLAYVFEGQGCFSDEPGLSSYDVEPASYFDLERKTVLGDHAVVLFGDGSRIKVATTDSALRFLLMSGRPLKEPVAWQGPIVMNTQDELRTAFREYRAGTFIKHPKPA
jgi:quercetin 2,3-dioxygenase